MIVPGLAIRIKRVVGFSVSLVRRSWGRLSKQIRHYTGALHRRSLAKNGLYARLSYWRHRRLVFRGVAVAILSGALVWGFVANQTVRATAIAPVNGSVTVLNTVDTIYFDTNGATVSIDNYTRQFNGYAWSTDLGWIAMGDDENNPAGGVSVDKDGVVIGSAKALNGGLINFSTNGAQASISSGVFSGYAWSEDLGWINLTGLTSPAFNPDLLAPDNPEVAGFSSDGGGSIAENTWYGYMHPYFTWLEPIDHADTIDPAGIEGYFVYFGVDSSADPTEYQTARDYTADLEAVTGTYYLRIKTVDKAGNVSSPATVFTYKYDKTPPTNVSFVSLPSQFIPDKDVMITWPTSGAQTANDQHSGLVGLQYRIGVSGTWYGLSHNGQQDVSDFIPLGDGSYTTDPTHDYPLLNDGNNMIYFRAIDNAGNVSETLTSAVIKINTSSPSSPQNVTATPSTNTTNSFAFNWQAPSAHVGQPNTLTYCYTINTLPTENTCTFTTAGQTSLPSGAYATQPGNNTFYVVARDEAGNINYDTVASVVFKADTSAPGVPLSMEIADVSVKSTQSWKLALSWEQPTDAGAGVASYRIYRSTSATAGFNVVATTQGNSFVDTNLNAVTYYYRVEACDSANNCGAPSSIVSKLPSGRYTSPAELIGAPSAVVGTRKAAISWRTARNSDSKVQIGTESGKYNPSETYSSEQTKDHRLEVEGLNAGTTYYYKVRWTDEDGNTGVSDEMSFTTLPAPVLSNIEVVKTNITSATIRFTSKDAKSVRLNYGKTNSFGGLKVMNTSSAESTYTIELDDLDDGSTYYFRLDATDQDGFGYEGNVFLFETPSRPYITNLQFQPIANEPTSTQKVTWQTNVPTTTQLVYGVEGTKGQEQISSNLTMEHEMIIRNLQDDSAYFVVAQSRDASGNVASSERQTFRTAEDTRPPEMSDVSIETSIKGVGADARGQIVITWKTDEPTTSQIAYGLGGGSGAYTNTTASGNRPQTEHTIVISDLRTSSVYYLQPQSTDNAGNVTKGDEQSVIIGRPTDNVLTIVLNALYKVFGL